MEPWAVDSGVVPRGVVMSVKGASAQFGNGDGEVWIAVWDVIVVVAMFLLGGKCVCMDDNRILKAVLDEDIHGGSQAIYLP